MDVAAIHEGNRDAWERTARAGYTGDIEARIEDLRSGVLNLMEPELRILAGLEEWCGRAIHLQCSHGQDALSLWKYGAHEIVGIDISATMLVAAKQKSDALGAPAQWIACDVLDTPHELDGTADLVYTGRGGICWMMDLTAWAEVVYRLLRPGGKLFLFEGHPLDTVWEEQASGYALREGASYFEPFPVFEHSFPRAAALRAEPNREVQLTSRLWTLGETVTTLVRAGLWVDLLEEHPEPFWDRFKQIPPKELKRLPHPFPANDEASLSKNRGMKKGYWIVAYRSVSDEAVLREYGALALPAIEAKGGHPLVRTADAIEPREAGLKQRVVVMEFETFARAVEAYESEAYQEALKVLGSAAERDFRIVEGA